MRKLHEEGCVCRDFHKSCWEGRCYLGGTWCPPHLYFLLEMKQFALKLCSTVSGKDLAQLALVPSWADSTLLTLGKKGEGLWCCKTLGKGERDDDTEAQRVSLAPTKSSMIGASCLALPPDQIQRWPDSWEQLWPAVTIPQKFLPRLRFDDYEEDGLSLLKR